MPGLAELSRSWRGLLVGVAMFRGGWRRAHPAGGTRRNPAGAVCGVSFGDAHRHLSGAAAVARYRLRSSVALISAARLLAFGGAAYLYGGSVQGPASCSTTAAAWSSGLN